MRRPADRVVGAWGDGGLSRLEADWNPTGRVAYVRAMLDRDFIDFQATVAGEYSLERELGRGGMGIVYLAREVQLDRLVAIKVLPQVFAERADVRERFLREARMAAGLSHPHIVPIYRVGEAGGFVFFAMAYVNGQTLGERLRAHGPLPPAAVTRMMREVAWALSYAHGRGIVHRDIKPDNILLEADTGRALVSDFGIARGTDDAALSDPGRIMGTAQFMSPEQAAGDSLDGRSDFYSLGVVGYLALSGRLPLDAQNVPALLVSRISTDAPPVSLTAPAAPRGLASVIDRCLRRNPDERFASGEELAEALEAAARPARARIPIALRVWAQTRDPLRPLYVAWSGALGIGLIASVQRGFANWGHTLGLGLLPLVPFTLFHARKAYQVFSAGYTLRDLRTALAAWRQERREELTFEFEQIEPRWARALRGLTYLSLTGVGMLVFYGVGIAAKWWWDPFIAMPGGRSLVLWIMGSAVATVTASNVLGVRLISKRIRPLLLGSLGSFIWNSKLGEWAARLLTPRRRKQVADLEFRPTEVALGVAAADLYAALPKAFREDLVDLPDVVARLEAHAAGARARIDELEALMALGRGAQGSAAPGALVATRDAAKRELAEAVAALEAIRLDLLRLHGGAVDLRPLTTVLDAARELGDQLDRLQQAKEEADDIVGLPRGLDLHPHTPA